MRIADYQSRKKSRKTQESGGISENWGEVQHNALISPKITLSCVKERGKME